MHIYGSRLSHIPNKRSISIDIYTCYINFKILTYKFFDIQTLNKTIRLLTSFQYLFHNLVRLSLGQQIGKFHDCRIAKLEDCPPWSFLESLPQATYSYPTLENRKIYLHRLQFCKGPITQLKLVSKMIVWIKIVFGSKVLVTATVQRLRQ